MSLRNVGYASLGYCATCFAGAAGSYLAIVLSGNAELRDSTGAVVENVIVPTSSFLRLALFAGMMTTIFCIGGLLGVWILASRVRGTPGRHLAGGTLLAVLGCGIFLLGASLGEDHLFLRAFEVAAVSIVAALLVRLYVAADRRLPASG